MQLLSGVNRSLLTILAETLETEHAALLGVESIVRADTDVDARMDVGAALAHKNVAGENELTVSALGAKALGVRVAAVLRYRARPSCRPKAPPLRRRPSSMQAVFSKFPLPFPLCLFL